MVTTALLGALAFVVLLGYALARPAAESLFLGSYTSSMLPTGWIAVTVLAAGVVAVLNRCATRVPLLRLFLWATGISAAALAAILLAADLPGATFALFLWKEVYVVVLLELFWSLVSLLSTPAAARRTYGLYCVMGSLGGIAGNLGGGQLALRISTRGVLWLVLPSLGAVALVLLALAARLPPQTQQQQRAAAAPASAPGGGLALLRRSDYLWLLLLIVAAVQLVVGLVDYQYNVALERAYPDLDARTAMIGKVYAVVDVGSIALQLLTGPILRLLGVAGTLLSVPAVISSAVLLFLVWPRLPALVLAKVATKCFDYSIFRAAKEMLYLPLDYQEKTQGKALIDMLVYRMAKGGASLLLLLPWARGGPLSGLTLALTLAWLLLTLVLRPRYERRAGLRAEARSAARPRGA